MPMHTLFLLIYCSSSYVLYKTNCFFKFRLRIWLTGLIIERDYVLKLCKIRDAFIIQNNPLLQEVDCSKTGVHQITSVVVIDY